MVVRYLRHARVQKRLSQDQLAELSGVPQNTISRIERGLRLKPHMSTLEKLARVLDVDQPAMLAMDLSAPTFDYLIKGTREERRAYIEVRRETGALTSFIANLERIFEAAEEDSSSNSLTRARLQTAFVLGYARAVEDATQLEHDEHSERKEEEVSTEESTRVLTASS